MTDWRYWITYTGTFSIDSDDEQVAAVQAAEVHAERLQEGTLTYMPEIEVEEIG